MTVQLLPNVTLPHGPQRVTVGGRGYAIPASAGVRPGLHDGVVYVIYLSRVHCLVAGGEAAIPNALRSKIASRFFGARR